MRRQQRTVEEVHFQLLQDLHLLKGTDKVKYEKNIAWVNHDISDYRRGMMIEKDLRLNLKTISQDCFDCLHKAWKDSPQMPDSLRQYFHRFNHKN